MTLSWKPILMRAVIGLALLFSLIVVAIPDFECARRPRSYETSAVASLKNIAIAQEQLRLRGTVDRDGDGKGEFGSFLELAGAATPRNGPYGVSGRQKPALLSRGFIEHADGVVTRGGYHFQLWLPSLDGGFVSAHRSGERFSSIDPERARREWRCYAWPALKDPTKHELGRPFRAYVVDQRGKVLMTRNPGHTYLRSESPHAHSASSPDNPRELAGEGPGFDSLVWEPIR